MRNTEVVMRRTGVLTAGSHRSVPTTDDDQCFDTATAGYYYRFEDVQDYRHRKRQSSSRIIRKLRYLFVSKFLPFLFLTTVLTTFLKWRFRPCQSTTLFRQHTTSAGTEVPTAAAGQAEPAPCSYRQLQKAFQPEKKVQSDSNTCWRLQDEILKVPVDAIVNRDTMQKLGNGENGSVFKAYVSLDGSSLMNQHQQNQGERNGNVDGDRNSNSMTLCSIAVKTDRCCKIGEIPFIHACTSSCIIAEPTYAWPVQRMRAPDKNRMRNEYTGALIFAAAQKAGYELPGILPTWAVLEGEGNHPGMLSNMLRRDKKEKSYFPFSGIVMPLQAFQSFDNLEAASPSLKTITAKRDDGQRVAEVARIMLPAAKALSFAHHLGIALQDMRPKNIGLIKSSQKSKKHDISHSSSSSSRVSHHAMLFDYTFASIVQDKCSFSRGEFEESCSFCRDENEFFATDVRTREIVGNNGSVLKSETKHFVDQFQLFLDKITTPTSPLSSSSFNRRRIASYLTECETMSSVVKILKRIIDEEGIFGRENYIEFTLYSTQT